MAAGPPLRSLLQKRPSRSPPRELPPPARLPPPLKPLPRGANRAAADAAGAEAAAPARVPHPALRPGPVAPVLRASEPGGREGGGEEGELREEELSLRVAAIKQRLQAAGLQL